MPSPKPHILPGKSGHFGLFSKKEAAEFIVAGASHVFSSTLGQREANAALVKKALSLGGIPQLSWESQIPTLTSVPLNRSKDRFTLIQEVIDSQPKNAGVDANDRCRSILEELLTNALFHSYRNPDLSDKYSRGESVTLSNEETVMVTYGHSTEGTYLSVKDQGGSLRLSHIANALARCFNTPLAQIEQKVNGAGLGLYMIFEGATHWKTVSHPGSLTETSCWIASRKHRKPDEFSFSFFERAKR